MLLCTGDAIGTRASKSLNPNANGVGEQKVIVYDSEGEVCYPWEALKENLPLRLPLESLSNT